MTNAVSNPSRPRFTLGELLLGVLLASLIFGSFAALELSGGFAFCFVLGAVLLATGTWTRRRNLAVAGGVIVSLAVIAYPFYGTVAICDGWYDLTINIDAESAEGVSRVAFIPANSSDLGDAVVAALDDMLPHMEQQAGTEPLTVNIGFSYRASNLGYTWGHVQQYSHVIVVLMRDDGSRTVHRLPVPHRSVSRKITVTAASALKSRGSLRDPTC